MELNILILISTEKYFRYISDKNTSHHILKSSNGQTKEFVLKTFQLDCFRKSFVLVLFLGRLWSISNSFERHHSLSGIGNPNFECFCWLFLLSTDSTRTAFILFLHLSLVKPIFQSKGFLTA